MPTPRQKVLWPNPYIFVSFINPRRACAVRITVLGLSVCLSHSILAIPATRLSAIPVASALPEL